MMSVSSRMSLAVVSFIALTGPALAYAPPEPADSGGAAKQWSDDVWRSALAKDQQSLERFFEKVPGDPDAQEAAAKFRESLELHLANTQKAQVKRDEAREKAMTEMREHIASGDLSKALRSAVTVQSLSDKLDMALSEPDIKNLITLSKERIPKAEADEDWLLAQELAFLLHTLFEDTGQVDEYRRLHDELDAVNRRVALLAQYAPRRLHELRIKKAERLGDEPVGEYHENPSNHWREKTRGIKP